MLVRYPLASARLALAAGVTFGLVSALYAAPARACGGFFCDVVNNVPVPVDQTGENIIFAIDGTNGKVEAHIQIQYTGDPAKFAWVIPVTAVPEFTIGSEQLFTNLLSSTVPTYSFSFASDCEMRDPPSLGCSSLAEQSGGDGSGAITSAGGDSGDSGGPQVVKREVVGAFEIVVLQGGTAQEVFDWLSNNGYYQDQDALPILEEYLKEKYYFAAAKLLQGAGVDELQPIVMTYAGDTPCVPLRLTRIAAMPDMAVRIFGLGHSRYAPSNYKHVELNDAAIDWVTNAANYNEVVGAAIDTPGSDGRGFITEFSGSVGGIDRTGIYSSAWRSETFVGAAPVDALDNTVVDALEDMGLVDCSLYFDGGECSYLHPQILPLLRTYLPAPPLIAESEFYNCMECYKDQIDLAKWDAAAFAQQLEERIIQPGKHAIDMLNRWRQVTRLLTIMSPEEMTADPEFVQNPDLPDVAAARTATRNVPCGGSDKMLLPSGEVLLLDPAGSWPMFPVEMPAALRIEQMAPSGAPQVLQDLKDQIRAAAKASNERFDYDDGRGISCTLRGGTWSGGAALAVVFAFAWRGRRRRR